MRRWRKREAHACGLCGPPYQRLYGRIKKAPTDLLRETEMIYGRLAAIVILIAPAVLFLVFY
jgi:hypothetical protein